MAIEIFNRQEIKFVIHQDDYRALIKVLQEHMVLDEHNKNGAPYTIYNLYIDTADSALIRKSLERPVFKEKIRLRSYYPFTDTQRVFLEMKKRYKRITNKRRTKITYNDVLRFIETGALPEVAPYMNSQVLGELAAVFSAHQYYPKTFISYDRVAYKSNDTDLRVTFDSNLRATRYGTDNEVQLLDDASLVMEIKSTNNIPLWLTELLASRGVYKQSFSKYGKEYMSYLMTQKGGDNHA
jgi:SPX domain protein involved in polyphosphate accumulation